jgi:hypothetical protein
MSALHPQLGPGNADGITECRVALQVSRRLTAAERLQGLAAGGKGGGRAVRYQPAAAAPEEVFLHPRSALAAAAPDMAVYTELLQTEKRAYMAGARIAFQL